jgi:hypothetical protein
MKITAVCISLACVFIYATYIYICIYTLKYNTYVSDYKHSYSPTHNHINVNSVWPVFLE